MSAQLTRDELLNRLDRMEDRLDDAETRLELASKKRDDLQEQVWELEDELEVERAENEELRETVEEQNDEIDALRRDQNRIARRTTGIEEEIGIDMQTSKDFADGRRSSPLYLLEHVGPDAVSDHPGATLERARVLLEKRDGWGEVRNNARYGKHRVLASREHDLASRLGDVRGEEVQWTQLKRAMQKLVSLGGDHITFDDAYESSGANYGKAIVWEAVEQ